jgi:hypothetical protein
MYIEPSKQSTMQTGAKAPAFAPVRFCVTAYFHKHFMPTGKKTTASVKEMNPPETEATEGAP